MKNLLVKATSFFLLCLLLSSTFAEAQSSRGRMQKTEVKKVPTQQTNLQKAQIQEPERATTTVTTLAKGTAFAVATTQALTLEELEAVEPGALVVTSVPVVLKEAIVINEKISIPIGTPAKLSITFTRGENGIPDAAIKLTELIYNKKEYNLASNTLNASTVDGLWGLYESRAGLSAASSFETEVPPDFRMNFTLDEPVLIGQQEAINELTPMPTNPEMKKKMLKTRGR